jgi:hypothetical protein
MPPIGKLNFESGEAKPDGERARLDYWRAKHALKPRLKPALHPARR